MSEIRLLRRVIFEEDANTAGERWPFRMLQAVEVAKRLGIRNFEMDVTGEAAEESAESVHVGWASIASMFSKVDGIPGDEWKAPTKSKGKEPRIVRVWAVVAADAETSA